MLKLVATWTACFCCEQKISHYNISISQSFVSTVKWLSRWLSIFLRLSQIVCLIIYKKWFKFIHIRNGWFTYQCFTFERIFISCNTLIQFYRYSTITVFHVTTYNTVFIIEATITRQKLPLVSRREFYAHFSDWLVGNIITSIFPTEFANLQSIWLYELKLKFQWIAIQYLINFTLLIQLFNFNECQGIQF